MPKNFSCNLGSLNLNEFVLNPYEDSSEVDFEGLKEAIIIAVEALDTIIDENKKNHALYAQADNSLNYRNIGLGVCGYANMLFKLGLKYGSPEAGDFTDDLFSFIQQTALIASNHLAKEKGMFPKCKPEVIAKSTILQNVPDIIKEGISKYGLRNCSLLSIAPTGSIASMLGVSGGCEPEFALSYLRYTDNLNESYKVYCKSVNEYCEKFGLSKANIEKSLPNYFVTSAQIPWRNRINIQAIMQKYVDTAISSTINLPNDIKIKDLEEMFLYAWSNGLKGLTIYRTGCKREGVLVEKPKNKEKEEIVKPRGYIKPANDNVIGLKRKLITGCGSLHFTAFFDVDDGELVEVYLSKGSTGGCNNFMIGLSRMISMSARAGVSVSEIVDQLMSTGVCGSYATRRAVKHDTSKGSCCPMAIGHALKEMWEEFQGKKLKPKEIKMNTSETVEPQTTPKCPECGEPLYFEGGCNICKSCGWSKCD